MTITTEACNEYYLVGKKFPEGLEEQLQQGLKDLENQIGKRFGHQDNPLLVSVRSGAKISMPGMMDTILNLGLNDITVQGLIKSTNNERFALDCYRRFIQMFGDVAMGVPHHEYEEILSTVKEEQEVKFDHQLTVESLHNIIAQYKELYQNIQGKHPRAVSAASLATRHLGPGTVKDCIQKAQ